ncbi:hypothetical protein STAS_14596, partial [Striga asiatica]
RGILNPRDKELKSKGSSIELRIADAQRLFIQLPREDKKQEAFYAHLSSNNNALSFVPRFEKSMIISAYKVNYQDSQLLNCIAGEERMTGLTLTESLPLVCNRRGTETAITGATGWELLMACIRESIKKAIAFPGACLLEADSYAAASVFAHVSLLAYLSMKLEQYPISKAKPKRSHSNENQRQSGMGWFSYPLFCSRLSSRPSLLSLTLDQGQEESITNCRFI